MKKSPTIFHSSMQRPTIFLSFLLTIIALLALYRYALLSSYTVQGIALAEYQAKIKELEIQNDSLRQQVLMDESYTHIASVAASEGFTVMPAIIYIKGR